MHGLDARSALVDPPSREPPRRIEQKFTGKERDAETGLDFFDARYFSGAQGRFTSPDWSAVPEPIPYASVDDPQSLNLYAYVRNNPLAHRDEDGHQEGAALTQDRDVRDLVAGRITQDEYMARIQARGAGAAIGLGAIAVPEIAGRLRALGTALFGWALSNPQKAQEAAVSAVEQISGVPMPNVASTFGFAKVEGTIEGFTYGRLANGAEVAAQFTQSGSNLTASVLGAFNPEGAKAAGTLNAIVEGAQAVAKSQGATSLTLQAVGVINPKLAALLVKQGFKQTTIKVGKEAVKAYEKKLEVQ